MLASLATIMKEKTALVTSMVYFALTMESVSVCAEDDFVYSKMLMTVPRY